MTVIVCSISILTKSSPIKKDMTQIEYMIAILYTTIWLQVGNANFQLHSTGYRRVEHIDVANMYIYTAAYKWIIDGLQVVAIIHFYSINGDSLGYYFE